MPKCTNEGIGRLLHAYEINILSEPEREQFEIHLMECEYCHDLLLVFERHAELLTSSDKVRSVLAEVDTSATRGESLIGRIARWLWPETPFLFKPAVAYLLVLLLIVPAYIGMSRHATRTIGEFQQSIYLSPNRSVSTNLRIGEDDNALLTFRFEGSVPGRPYRVLIESEDGDIIYLNDQFSGFDEREIGILSLELTEMNPGKYRLIIDDPHSDTSVANQEYFFYIEE